MNDANVVLYSVRIETFKQRPSREFSSAGKGLPDTIPRAIAGPVPYIAFVYMVPASEKYKETVSFS